MRFYKNKQNHKIAYKSVKGRRLGVIFIHGLNSDMNGGKALAIEQYAKKNKLNFIRFDCRGHGSSEGKFEDFTISDWRKDLLDIIDNVAKGPQILIGSSMGGWLMFLAAKMRSSRIVGLVGLAAAPDYIDNFYKKLFMHNSNQYRKIYYRVHLSRFSFCCNMLYSFSITKFYKPHNNTFSSIPFLQNANYKCVI